MGLFKPKRDRSAEIARQQETQRTARITQGRASIGKQFEQFDDPFFSGVEQSALDFFNPQLEDQFQTTREKLIKNLARSGNLNASTGARQIGDLQKALGEQQGIVGNRALGFANDARADVESNRSALLSSLNATADPFAAANSAAARAQSLSAPQQFSPLGDLFSKFAGVASQNIAAAQRGFRNPASSLFGPSSSGGSSTIVG